MIWGVLKWAWTFVSPLIVPRVVRYAPWLASYVAGFSLRRALRRIAIAAAFVGVIWLTWTLTRPDPDAPLMVAVSAVEAQRLKAENESLRGAVAKAEETLRQRERGAALADQLILSLEAEKEALRALSANPDAPVFAADDPWLLGRR